VDEEPGDAASELVGLAPGRADHLHVILPGIANLRGPAPAARIGDVGRLAVPAAGGGKDRRAAAPDAGLFPPVVSPLEDLSDGGVAAGGEGGRRFRLRLLRRAAGLVRHARLVAARQRCHQPTTAILHTCLDSVAGTIFFFKLDDSPG
jgi:hypothetical protein